jgi:hypothetical protein
LFRASSADGPPMFVVITKPKFDFGQNIALARFKVFDPV